MVRGADRYDERAAMIEVRQSETTTATSTAIASRASGASTVITSGMPAPTANESPTEPGQHRTASRRDLVDAVLGLQLGGQRVGGVELLGDLAGQLRGQSPADVVVDQLGQLVVGVGLQQPLLVRDRGELGVALGRRLRPLGAAGAERSGDGGRQGGGDQQLVVGPGAGEALQQAGRGDDAVVRVDHPGLHGLAGQPASQTAARPTPPRPPSVPPAADPPPTAAALPLARCRGSPSAEGRTSLRIAEVSFHKGLAPATFLDYSAANAPSVVRMENLRRSHDQPFEPCTLLHRRRSRPTKGVRCVVDWSVMTMSRVNVNGLPRSLDGAGGETTLLDFLRDAGLTGTKEGCAEGECGACAVVVLKPDADAERSTWTAINACLVPAAALDGQEVVTAEGLGTPAELHPVQREMAVRGGSQCGYCTPGFVCSMAAEFYRRGRCAGKGAETEDVVEPPAADHEHGPNGFDLHALSGNLCRCTGYRPIRDAAYALEDPEPTDPLAARTEEPAPLRCRAPSPGRSATTCARRRWPRCSTCWRSTRTPSWWRARPTGEST